MTAITCILVGYLVGCINPAYIIGKLRGFDIRKRGSGNAGASNAVILMGKKVGAISAVLDIFKACLAIIAMSVLFPGYRQAKILTGVACIMGHIFPAPMRFKGGKGLACLGGMILAYDWKVFLIMLLCELVFVLIVDYICFVPITASIVFPFVYGFRENDWISAAIFLVATAVIIYKHVENLHRIGNGTEAHFSFLWKREKEIARLSENIDANAAENEDEKVDERS